MEETTYHDENEEKTIGLSAKEFSPEILDQLIQKVGGELHLQGVEKPEQIKKIREKLESCIGTENVVEALATVGYAINNTQLTAKDLNLVSYDDPNSIVSIAYSQDKDEWAINFSGFCKSLDYVEEGF